MSTIIQRIFLLALISAPNFHDTRSGYLLVKLNSQTDGPDSMDPGPLAELTEMSLNSRRSQGFRSLGIIEGRTYNYYSYGLFYRSLDIYFSLLLKIPFQNIFSAPCRTDEECTTEQPCIEGKCAGGEFFVNLFL